MSRVPKSGDMSENTVVQSIVSRPSRAASWVPIEPIHIIQYMSCCTSESIELTTILPRTILPKVFHHLPDVREKSVRKPLGFHEFPRIYPGAPA